MTFTTRETLAYLVLTSPIVPNRITVDAMAKDLDPTLRCFAVPDEMEPARRARVLNHKPNLYVPYCLTCLQEDKTRLSYNLTRFCHHCYEHREVPTLGYPGDTRLWLLSGILEYGSAGPEGEYLSQYCYRLLHHTHGDLPP